MLVSVNRIHNKFLALMANAPTSGDAHGCVHIQGYGGQQQPSVAIAALVHSEREKIPKTC